MCPRVLDFQRPVTYSIQIYVIIITKKCINHKAASNLSVIQIALYVQYISYLMTDIQNVMPISDTDFLMYHYYT